MFTVFTYVNGRSFKFAAIFLMAAMLLAGMERTPIPSSVCTFVQSYQAIKNTHAPLGMLERLVYSFALTRQRAVQCRDRHSAV